MDFWTFNWAVAALMFGSVLGMVYIDSVAKEKGMDPPFNTDNIVDGSIGDAVTVASILSALWLPLLCILASIAVISGVIWFIKKVILANTVDKIILRLLKERKK